jgi:hypothetical protein
MDKCAFDNGPGKICYAITPKRCKGCKAYCKTKKELEQRYLDQMAYTHDTTSKKRIKQEFDKIKGGQNEVHTMLK